MGNNKFISRRRAKWVSESEAVERLWRPANSAVHGANDHANDLSELQRRIAALERGARGGLNNLHPFKIYKLPAYYRSSHTANDWRKVRVRVGHVFVGPLFTAVGTDGANNADIETYLDNPMAIDVTVPTSTLKYYFWVRYDGSGAQLYAGTTAAGAINPATGSSLPDTDWVNFPDTDSKHILIGWVDTRTAASSKMALVTQLVRADIYGAGGGGTSGILEYTFDQAFANYIRCKDGSGNYIAVAKPPRLRHSITSEAIEGTAWSYTYEHDPGGIKNTGGASPLTDPLCFVYRKATAGSNVEVQGITPAYLASSTGGQINGSSTADKILAIAQTPETGVTLDSTNDTHTPALPSGHTIALVQVGPHHWTKYDDQTFGQ